MASAVPREGHNPELLQDTQRRADLHEVQAAAASLNAWTAGTTPYDLQVLARQYFDHLDRRDLESLASMFTTNARFSGLGPQLLDVKGVKETMGAFFKAFPDSRMPVDGVIANNNEVAIRHRFEGTHNETFMGIPATKKRVSITATVTLRVTDGKITEGILHADMLGLMVQLGAVPAPKG